MNCGMKPLIEDHQPSCRKSANQVSFRGNVGLIKIPSSRVEAREMSIKRWHSKLNIGFRLVKKVLQNTTFDDVSSQIATTLDRTLNDSNAAGLVKLIDDLIFNVAHFSTLR